MKTGRLRGGLVADVAACLRRYVRGELRPQEINRLVFFAATIARQKVGGRLSAAARAEEVSIPQMAVSIISRLFGPSVSAAAGLAATFKDDLDADDTALYLRFQAVVARFTSQELFHRWKQSDPASARLWRGVHHVVQHDPRITCFPADRPEWAVPAAEQDPADNFVELSFSEIKNIIGCVYDSAASIGQIIVDSLAEAARRHDRPPAVRIEDLFAALREANADTAEAELTTRLTTPPTDPLLMLAIENATEQALTGIRARIKKYENSGKLRPDIIGYFNGALADLVTDCADGGPARSYYQYLSAHWPELTMEDYRRDFRAKFEYLAESARDGFYDYLKTYFGEQSRQAGRDATI